MGPFFFSTVQGARTGPVGMEHGQSTGLKGIKMEVTVAEMDSG